MNADKAFLEWWKDIEVLNAKNGLSHVDSMREGFRSAFNAGYERGMGDHDRADR